MIEKISEPVSVLVSFDAKTGRVQPRILFWKNQSYPIVKVGLHHTYREGRTLYHVFSVASRSLFFRLVLNSENLRWRLEEVSDGLPS